MPRRNTNVDQNEEYRDSGLNMNQPSEADLSVFDTPMDDISGLSREGLPFDTYTCLLQKVELVPTKTSPPKPRLNFQWRIVEGEYAKRVIFDGANITPESVWVVALRGQAIDREAWAAFEEEIRSNKAAGKPITPREIASWFQERVGSATVQIQLGAVKKPDPRFKREYDITAVKAAA